VAKVTGVIGTMGMKTAVIVARAENLLRKTLLSRDLQEMGAITMDLGFCAG